MLVTTEIMTKLKDDYSVFNSEAHYTLFNVIFLLYLTTINEDDN